MQLNDILERRWVIPTAAGVACLGSGFGLGYLVGRRNSVVEYRYDISADAKSESLVETLLDREADIQITQGEAEEIVEAIEEGEDIDLVIHEDGPEEAIIETPITEGLNDLDPETERVRYDRIEEAKEKVEAIIHEAEYEAPAEPQMVILGGEEPQPYSVFPDPEDMPVWDYAVESASRITSDLPYYTIHQDEFMAEEAEYTQATVTYYEGDDILVDEAEQIVPNHRQIMGMFRFGHGTHDPNVVYVRNDSLKREWEVLRNTGHYMVEIGGLSIEDIENQYDEEDRKRASELRRMRSD